MKDYCYEIPKEDIIFMNNLCNDQISKKDFMDQLLNRFVFEWAGFSPDKLYSAKRYNSKKDCFEFYVNKKWRTFMHPIKNHIDRETHFFIERDISLNGSFGYFEDLSDLDYSKYGQKVLRALVNRAINFHNHHKTFFPVEKEFNPEFSNLRSSLEEYL